MAHWISGYLGGNDPMARINGWLESEAANAALAHERERLTARMDARKARETERAAIESAGMGDEYRWTCDGEPYSSWYVTDGWEGTCRAMRKTVARERSQGHTMVVEHVQA